MSKIFTGTLTINDGDYEVSGPLSKNGIRITGTLVFGINQSVLIPIQLIQTGDQVQTSSSFFFTDTDGNVIRVLPISAVDTSVGAEFSSINITETDIEINGNPGLLSLSIAEMSSEIETDSFTEETAVPDNSDYRRPINRTRINEMGNFMDHYGAILSVPRRDGEGNPEYLTRIRAAAFKRAGSDYSGMINGINREIGLDVVDAIEVSIRPEVEDKYNLCFIVDENSVRIYSHWVDREDQLAGLRPTLEQEVSLTDPSVSTLGSLVDWINTSAFYSARIMYDTEKLSKFIVKYDSRHPMYEQINPQEYIKLKKNNIIPGSLEFKRQSSLSKEIAFESTLTEQGEYQVGYGLGLIKCHTHPRDSFDVSYLTSEEKFILSYSEIRILDLQNEAVQEMYFEQIEKNTYSTIDGMTINGLPTSDMYGIIYKILTAGQFNQYWGE